MFQVPTPCPHANYAALARKGGGTQVGYFFLNVTLIEKWVLGNSEDLLLNNLR